MPYLPQISCPFKIPVRVPLQSLARLACTLALTSTSVSLLIFTGNLVLRPLLLLRVVVGGRGHAIRLEEARRRMGESVGEREKRRSETGRGRGRQGVVTHPVDSLFDRGAAVRSLAGHRLRAHPLLDTLLHARKCRGVFFQICRVGFIWLPFRCCGLDPTPSPQ